MPTTHARGTPVGVLHACDGRACESSVMGQAQPENRRRHANNACPRHPGGSFACLRWEGVRELGDGSGTTGEQAQACALCMPAMEGARGLSDGSDPMKDRDDSNERVVFW